MSAREPRDNGERPTRPDIVDWDTFDVPDRHLDRPSESGPQLTESEMRQIEVVRLLTKTARAHAPKLSWRTDHSIAEIIHAEVLPDARFIAGSLPGVVIPKVIETFVEVLLGEIERHRRARK